MSRLKRIPYIPTNWNAARTTIQQLIQRLFVETREEGCECLHMGSVPLTGATPNSAIAGDPVGTMFEVKRNRQFTGLKVRAYNKAVRTPNETLTVVLGAKKASGGTFQQVFSVVVTLNTTGRVAGSSTTVVTAEYDILVPGDNWFIEAFSSQTNQDVVDLSVEVCYEDWMPYTGQGARA